MIKPVDADNMTRLAEHPLVRSRLAGTTTDILKLLTDPRFVLLSGDGDDVAVFEHNYAGRYTATVLDIDHPDFAWEALEYLFGSTSCDLVQMTSHTKDAGEQYGAYFVGVTSLTNEIHPYVWRLQRDFFMKALAARRAWDDRPVTPQRKQHRKVGDSAAAP